MPPTWDAEFERLVRQALGDLPADQPLRYDQSTAAAGLDSTATLGLVLAVEDTYGISLPDELLCQETFATPGALWEVISELRGSRTVQPE